MDRTGQHGHVKLVDININPATYDEFTKLYFINNKYIEYNKVFIYTTRNIENINPKTNDLQPTLYFKKKI